MSTGAPGRHVGLVRAIMQGREGLTRQVLVATVRAAGGSDVRTHLSTGNLSFGAPDGAAVCEEVAHALTARLGRATPVLHRTHRELAEIADALPPEPEGDEQLIVLFGATGGPLPDALARTDRLAGEPGVTFLGAVGDTAWFVRHRADGPHPMPLLERVTGRVLTARSAGSVRTTVARGG